MNYDRQALVLHSNKQKKKPNDNQIKRRTLIRAAPCCRLPRHQHPIMLLNFNYGIVFIELAWFFFFSLSKAFEERQKLSLLTCVPQQICLSLKYSGFTRHIGLRLKRSRGHPVPRAVTWQTRRVQKRVVAPTVVYWPSCWTGAGDLEGLLMPSTNMLGISWPK